MLYQIHAHLLEGDRLVHSTVRDQLVQSKDDVKRMVHNHFLLNRSSVFGNDCNNQTDHSSLTFGEHVKSLQILDDITILCCYYQNHQIFDWLIYISKRSFKPTTKHLILFASTNVCCLFISPSNLGNTARMPYESRYFSFINTSTRMRFIFTYCRDRRTRSSPNSQHPQTFSRLC